MPPIRKSRRERYDEPRRVRRGGGGLWKVILLVVVAFPILACGGCVFVGLLGRASAPDPQPNGQIAANPQIPRQNIQPIPILAAKNEAVPAAQKKIPQGDFKEDGIEIVRDYLSGDGYPTGAWKELADGEYYACSEYKDVAPGSLSHVAYYVGGTKDRVSNLALELNLHSQLDAPKAQSEMIAIGNKVSRLATGDVLPLKARQHILLAKDGQWIVGKYQVQIRRTDHRNGVGYSLQIRIE